MPDSRSTEPIPASPSAFSAGFFYAGFYAVLGVILPFLGPFLAGRGLSTAVIALLMAAIPLARAFYAPLVGSLADRGMWRPGWLALHLVIAAAAAAGLMVATSLVWIAVCIVLVGALHGAVLPLVEARLLQSPLAQRYGPIRLWGSISFIAVAVGAGPVIARWPTAAVPLGLAALLVLTAVACRPFELDHALDRVHSTAPLPRGVWILLIVLIFNQVAHGPFYALLSVDLERNGWSPTAIGVTWSVGVLAEMVLFAAGTWLTRRYSLNALLLVALAITPLRWLAFALPPTIASVIGGHLGHAFSFALAHLAGIQLVQRLSPEGGRQRAQALYSGLVFGLGIALGSAAAGPLDAWFGGRGMFLAAAALSAVLVLAAFSLRHEWSEPAPD